MSLSISQAVGWTASGERKEYNVSDLSGAQTTLGYPGYKPNENKVVHLLFKKLSPANLLTSNIIDMITSASDKGRESDRWDNWRDEIEPALAKAGVSKEDSDYVYMSIKDSLEGLLINDDGTTCEPSDVIGEFTAEVTDTLSFVLPDMPAEEIANLASDIVSAVNKPVEYDFDYEADLPGPVESEIMDEIENNDRTPEIDTESNDDLDPTFWD